MRAIKSGIPTKYIYEGEEMARSQTAWAFIRILCVILEKYGYKDSADSIWYQDVDFEAVEIKGGWTT